MQKSLSALSKNRASPFHTYDNGTAPDCIEEENDAAQRLTARFEPARGEVQVLDASQSLLRKNNVARKCMDISREHIFEIKRMLNDVIFVIESGEDIYIP